MNEFATLCYWLQSAKCVRDDQARYVWLREPHIVDTKTPLHRIHWQTDEQSVFKDLEMRPNFYIAKPKDKNWYKDFFKPENKHRFMITAYPKRCLFLANVAGYEVQERVDMNVLGAAGEVIRERLGGLKQIPRDRGDPIYAQRWLTYEAVRSLIPKEQILDGIWDNCGNDVLLVDSLSVLDIKVTSYPV